MATLASLDFHAKGWNPQVTTFGEPRVGNKALMRYIDNAFPTGNETAAGELFRRVTHVDDPIPLLPLSEWGFSMHAGEIYIDKPDLPPEVSNLRRCEGDRDPKCIAGGEESSDSFMSKLKSGADIEALKHRWLGSKDFWKVPARFRIWQLFFAHRDYFWRLGLCLPVGNFEDWYHTHPLMDVDHSEQQ